MTTGSDRSSPVAGSQCLVLGAGGFIGTNLCCALLRAGAHVHAFGRRRSYPDALHGVRWTMGEFADRIALSRAVEGADFIFHLLGGSTPESSNRDPIAELTSGTMASVQLLEICRASSPRKIVFVSSGGTVYGIPAQIPIPETAPTDPIAAYGVGKLTVEKYLRLYEYLHGLRYSILRVANPVGPYQNPERRQGVVAALLLGALSGRPAEIWGDGSVVRDFLYVEDVVEALIAAAGYDGPCRTFNVGSGIGRSIIDVVADIQAIVGPPEITRVHTAARPTDVPVNVLDISLIGREMGWVPRTDWHAALRSTADWIRATHLAFG